MTSNQYYSDAKARAAISLTGSGPLTYNNTTGVFTQGATALVWTNIGSGGSTLGANVAASTPVPQFVVDTKVEVRGVATLSAAKNVGDPLFTLPAAAQPAAVKYASFQAVDTLSMGKECLVQITTGGVCNVFNGALANGDTLYLDTINYSL